MYTIPSPQLLVSQTHTKTEHQFRALHPTAPKWRGPNGKLDSLPGLCTRSALVHQDVGAMSVSSSSNPPGMAKDRLPEWAHKQAACSLHCQQRQAGLHGGKNAVCRSIQSVRCKYSWSKFECLLCQRKAENFVTSGVYESVLPWHISNLW